MGDFLPPGGGWEWLGEQFAELNGAERWLPLLQSHSDLLSRAADRVQTTTVGSEQAITRLYGESLELLRIIRGRVTNAPKRVVDVGSGGGFPGLVFAAVEPTWELVLVESLHKRAALLEDMAASLGLSNVSVVAARAEEAGRGSLRESADLVTAKAVAELRVLVEYVGPLARPGGLVALPKGSRLVEEMRVAGAAMEALQLRVVEQVACRDEVSATPWALLLEKTGTTPERYPRRPGMPQKRPL